MLKMELIAPSFTMCKGLILLDHKKHPNYHWSELLT